MRWRAICIRRTSVTFGSVSSWSVTISCAICGLFIRGTAFISPAPCTATACSRMLPAVTKHSSTLIATHSLFSVLTATPPFIASSKPDAFLALASGTCSAPFRLTLLPQLRILLAVT
jgi:hypothetical protein